jgi:hypothetical protein
MSKTKTFDSYDKEKRIHRVEKSKNKLDKHRKIIYNYASSKEDDAFDEYLDYAFNNKIKRR